MVIISAHLSDPPSESTLHTRTLDEIRRRRRRLRAALGAAGGGVSDPVCLCGGVRNMHMTVGGLKGGGLQTVVTNKPYHCPSHVSKRMKKNYNGVLESLIVDDPGQSRPAMVISLSDPHPEGFMPPNFGAMDALLTDLTEKKAALWRSAGRGTLSIWNAYTHYDINEPGLVSNWKTEMNDADLCEEKWGVNEPVNLNRRSHRTNPLQAVLSHTTQPYFIERQIGRDTRREAHLVVFMTLDPNLPFDYWELHRAARDHGMELGVVMETDNWDADFVHEYTKVFSNPEKPHGIDLEKWEKFAWEPDGRRFGQWYGRGHTPPRTLETNDIGGFVFNPDNPNSNTGPEIVQEVIINQRDFYSPDGNETYHPVRRCCEPESHHVCDHPDVNNYKCRDKIHRPGDPICDDHLVNCSRHDNEITHWLGNTIIDEDVRYHRGKQWCIEIRSRARGSNHNHIKSLEVVSPLVNIKRDGTNSWLTPVTIRKWYNERLAGRILTSAEGEPMVQSLYVWKPSGEREELYDY